MDISVGEDRARCREQLRALTHTSFAPDGEL